MMTRKGPQVSLKKLTKLMKLDKEEKCEKGGREG
jgi:hypothetical protein